MSEREVTEPHMGDKRNVRRDADGRITRDQVDIGKSFAADRRQLAKAAAKPGQDDRGGRQ